MEMRQEDLLKKGLEGEALYQMEYACYVLEGLASWEPNQRLEWFF